MFEEEFNIFEFFSVSIFLNGTMIFPFAIVDILNSQEVRITFLSSSNFMNTG